MLEQLISLLAFGTITLAAFGLGLPLVRGLCAGEHDLLSLFTWSTVLGLIVGGTLLAGLGLMGSLNAPLIGALSIAAGFGALIQITLSYYRWLDAQMQPDPEDDEDPDAPPPAPSNSTIRTARYPSPTP